jgi:hypothetical protein
LDVDDKGNVIHSNEKYDTLNKSLASKNDELDAKKGQAFINKRQEGMEEEVKFFGSSAGTALGEANDAIGQYEALLVNNKEKIKQNTINDVLSGSGTLKGEYSKPEVEARVRELSAEYQASIAIMKDENASKEAKLNAGATIKRAVSETNAIAENENNASNEAKIDKESNLKLAENIKNDTAMNQDFWDAGSKLGEQFSKGLLSAFNQISIDLNIRGNTYYTPSTYAYGLDYVPYDNFLARLHEGERVLTASEARNYNSSSPNVTISGNSFAVREEADIEKIAMQIVSQFIQACDLAV